MGPEERCCRTVARFQRSRARHFEESWWLIGHQDSANELNAKADREDLRADLIALEGVDLSVEALFCPGPGDALALRGEG